MAFITKKRYFWLTSLYSLVFISGIFYAQPVIAQETPQQPAPQGALTIIPPKFELFSNPGESIAERIRIKNEADSPANYSVVVEDFTTTGEEGQVVLEADSNATFSLAKWIEPSTKELVFQPKEEKTITFFVNTPKDAEPGGHYASILFQTGGEEKVDGGAAVATRIGALVLLRVSGNVTENAQLETFTTDSYQEKSPIEFLLRLKNNGNTHIRPEGTIVITDIFGKKVDEIPLDSRNVLPNATRKMGTAWGSDKVLGNYTATLIATYGQQNLPLTAAVKFTVIPRYLLIIGILGAIAMVGFIITLFVGRKRFGKILRVIFKG